MTRELTKENLEAIQLRSDMEFSPQIKSLVERRVVRAVKSTPVSEMLSEAGKIRQVAEFIETMFVRAEQMSSLKLENLKDPSDRAQVNQLIQNVLLDFGWLKFDELGVIFQEGLKGNLGEVYGVDPKTVNDWVKKYNETVRKPTMKKQLQHETAKAEVGSVDKNEAYAQTIEELRRIWAEVRKTGYIKLADHALADTVLFPLAEHAGVIHMTTEEKQAKLDEAMKLERTKAAFADGENVVKARAKTRCRVDAMKDMLKATGDIEPFVKMVIDIRNQVEEEQKQANKQTE